MIVFISYSVCDDDVAGVIRVCKKLDQAYWFDSFTNIVVVRIRIIIVTRNFLSMVSSSVTMILTAR